MGDKPLLVHFEDEARFGRISNLQSCWIQPGCQPCVPKQVVRQFLYAFATVCPQKGNCHSLIMPYCNTDTMQIFLNSFSHRYYQNRNIILLDQAGWHTSQGLQLPHNVVLLNLPPYSPELNPTELLWRQIRKKYFNNCLLSDLDQVEQKLAQALKFFSTHPATVKSLTSFPWIY